MGELFLVRPSRELEGKAMDYRKEYMDYGEIHINGSGGFIRYEDYDAWLQKVLAAEKEEVSEDSVPASTYFTVRKSDEKIIGTIQLRYELSDFLRNYGGHIGYGIRPSERRKGYGAEQLALVLEEARRIGLDRVMITCNKENRGSAAVILRNGGVLGLEGIYEQMNELIQIYWITL